MNGIDDSNTRPLSDLKSKYDDIVRAVTETQKPIFLEQNKHIRLVCMSYEDYEKQLSHIRLMEKFIEEERKRKTKRGVKRLSDSEVFDVLNRELGSAQGGEA